jgi:hypothetical protein
MRNQVRECTLAMLLDAAIEDLEATGESSLEEETKNYRLYVRRSTCPEPCGKCWSVRLAFWEGIVRHGWEPVEPDAIMLAYTGFELCPRSEGSDGSTIVRNVRG